MKYFFIAGEPSGDLHGANLISQLKQFDKDGDFCCWGGDLMREQGGRLVKHYRETAFMGITEVLRNLGAITRFFKECKKNILAYRPDALILIDYPGFNLRMARFAKKKGIKVFYYISPKLWAWKPSRVRYIQRYVDRMFVVLPFETDFYKKYNVAVEYMGNPVLDAVDQFLQTPRETAGEFRDRHGLDERPIVALLPGSRKQEVDLILPEMMDVVINYPDCQFVVAGSTSLAESYYSPFLKGYNATLIYGRTYDILSHAAAAVVTSGTATLETALLNVPQVVCYKTTPLTYWIGRLFVHIRFFSLVNLIMDQEVVKELLHFNLQDTIRSELGLILYDNSYRENMLKNYSLLRRKLGEPGTSKRVAERMFDLLLQRQINI
jgi:lipid-A-disaccharide synthase